ncbi:ferritin [Salicibibacter halophilus]|uniref:Ferritin n=1 Tax=Salicibibacter halophilus TaxID=2502791 RepID=A0A514LKL9_9BACI|nr:ferritin [Salicibibacter halophilus]QDI92085.1 ferritin [Salicibibacter halophilus]
MLSNKVGDALNEQMNNELQAAQEYMAMAAYCNYKSYDGFANFYFQQAKEERYHAMKIYNFLDDRGHRAVFSGIKEPRKDFDSLLDTFEAGLAQEKQVTKNFYHLSDLAWEEREHQTLSFLNWFLDEQVEEEAMFDTHIDYLKRIKDDSNALYIYELELAKREFKEDEE